MPCFRKTARNGGFRVGPPTRDRNGILTARKHYMPTDLLALIRRDHTDLESELTNLLDPGATAADLRMALDGVRLGLMAHTEAEDIILGQFEVIPALQTLIAQGHAAHLAQEGALSALVSARPQTPGWYDRALNLRELVKHHAAHEEAYLIPVLRRNTTPEIYAALAGAFATERLRQLALLQPSAPIFVPEYAELVAG